MFAVCALLLLISMGLTLVRALRGPTVFDRILAVNMFGTATILMIPVLGFLDKPTDFVDIALIYALVSFTGTLSVLRFVEYDQERRKFLGDVEGDAAAGRLHGDAPAKGAQA